MKKDLRNSKKEKFQARPAREESRGPKQIAKAPEGDFYPRTWRAVVGDHAIREALAVNPKAAVALWLQQGWETHQDLKKLHQEFRSNSGVPADIKEKRIEMKPETWLARLSSSHQGAALFMLGAPALDWEILLNKEEANVVLLDGIEDPHNLGAILRTSWLMSVDAILIPQDRAARLTPIVHKVACGGVEHVPVEICNQFAQPLERLKEAGFWVYGLSHEAKSTIHQIKIPKKAVWCVGAEDKGLRTTTSRLCDDLIKIPQAAAEASYNASVAAGMVLFEATRQQGL